MRLLKKKKILLSLMIIILFYIINSGKVFGAGIELNFGGAEGVAHAWQLQPSPFGTWFCVDSSKALKFVDDFGKKSEGLVYMPTGRTIELNPRLAYALYYIRQQGGIQGNESRVQSIIWAAAGDPSGSYDVGGSIGARVNQYFSVHDQIFSRVNGDLFKTTTNQQDLKVLVDQINGTYTVGPYKLVLNVNNVNQTIRTILYNEIIGSGNQGFSTRNRFAQWSGTVAGINGTNVELVDENGKKIRFPDFVNEKPFFIRFKPNNNGAISDIGQPRINVSYVREITLANSTTTTTTTITGSSTGSIVLPVFECTDIIVGDQNVNLAADDARLTFGNVIDITEEWIDRNHVKHWTGHISARADVLVHFGHGIDAPYTFEDLSLGFEYKVEGQYRGYIDANDNGEYDTGETRLYDYPDECPNPPSNPATALRLGWEVQTVVHVRPHEYQSLANNIQPIAYVPTYIPIEIDFSTVITSETGEISGGTGVSNLSVRLPTKKINMQLGGHVFLDNPENKTGKTNGRRLNSDSDTSYAGIQVQLWELDNTQDTTGTLIATTTTDKNGRYKFYGLVNSKPLINPLKKYYVTFTYNGQIYQSTYYKNNLTGGFSNAKDVDREAFNTRFKTIYSDTNNYEGSNSWNKSYALYEKIKNKNGDYIYKGKEGEQTTAFTYNDVWNKFIEFATNTTTYSAFADYTSLDKDATKTWASGTSKTKVTTWENTGYSKKDSWHNYTYDDALTKLKTWLISNEINMLGTDADNLIQFIKDSMITSTTLQTVSNKKIVYPVYDKFITEKLYDNRQNANNSDYNSDNIKTIKMYAKSSDTSKSTFSYLYTKHSDQSRYVDYGITSRIVNDLALQKDVYKATVIVNGKKQEYIYSKKNLNSNGQWDIKVRASDALYNGQDYYQREVRPSEYLYNGTDGYDNPNNAKNLQVYVTYRIAVKNQGNVRTKIEEIVDYYDDGAYEFDGTLANNNTYNIKSYKYSPTEEKKYGQNGESYVNSYIGSDSKGNILNQSLIVKTKGIKDRPQETISGGNYNLKGLYLTGIKSTEGKDYLEPGQFAFTYITFKVKNDNNTNKVKLDQDLLNGSFTVGKRNIAEINAYSTQYVENTLIPNYLKTVTNNGTTEYETVNQNVGGKDAGLIDTDSNPGSLTSKDLNNNGDIITNKNDETKDRQQDDTDKAPNIKLIIDSTANDIRVLSGTVFEDNRTKKSELAVIGNGLLDNNETKINGVTIDLIELVQNVDENGIFDGTYSGEKIWETYNYTINSNNRISLNGNAPSSIDYFSGYGQYNNQGYQIILNGTGILTPWIPENIKNLKGKNAQGQYAFVSLPAGDFYIRFKYGDKERTVLKSENNEVNNLTGNKGYNEKSYNGQDYKSTIYQFNLSQDTQYNSIRGFKDYSGQNYSSESSINNGTDKNSMYYYDIAIGDTNANVSDAKDLKYYRNKANTYSQTQNNHIAEVLCSFEKLGQVYGNENKANNQRNLIKELEDNTYQVAQTGIIKTEVERNRTETDTKTQSQDYIISNINLGLVERPRAQLELSKEVSNFRLTLQNGTPQFDTNKSVRNLYYAQHNGHSTQLDKNYDNINNAFKLREVVVNQNNRKDKPELIQMYLDDELMEGSTLNVEYTISVKNVGDVDYLDDKFYYTGNTENASESNISKTNVLDAIDYASNAIKYVESLQNDGVEWKLKTANELVGIQESNLQENYSFSDEENKVALVNRTYYDKLKPYSAMLSTDKLSKDLLPQTYSTDNEKISNKTTLVLSTEVSSNVEGGNNLVYNNLAEITKFSNTQGRRMQFSVAGNQPMADQNLGNNASQDADSKVDLVTPTEIDADSSQKIILMPPTGENKNYITEIIALVLASSVVLIGIILLKKKVVKK